MIPKKFITSLLLDALEACSPSRAVEEAVVPEGNQLTINGQKFDLKDRPVYLLAVGKASIPMCNAALKVLGDRIRKSLVITSDGSAVESCNADEVIVGDHPVPKENSLKAGGKAVQFLKAIPENALVLTLISGGTSSLMCQPPQGISIDDLNKTFELLNNSGANIQDINTVRKHCSQIKGGQLPRYLNPNITLIDLAVSDVPNNDLSIIGSGPTAPDLSTFQDAYHILLEFDLWDELPPKVREHIEMGIDGQVPETLKPNEDPLAEHYSYIIGSAQKLAQTIAQLAIDRGCDCRVADNAFNDDVEKVAASIAGEVLPVAPKNAQTGGTDPSLFIFYGESTVDVGGNGKGGRNQELALRGALKIAGYENITWLSAGTDGVDGPTDAAGAMVDGSTIAKARELGLNPEEYLRNNDSYHFHEKVGTLFKPGPTGNNLMDVVLVLVDSD
jgi:glycerate-2-kinase